MKNNFKIIATVIPTKEKKFYLCRLKSMFFKVDFNKNNIV
jgi:hypothetical protein